MWRGGDVYYSFRDLQNYTTLKPDFGTKELLQSFRDLQNYTTLKLGGWHAYDIPGFRDLQNYTTLKPQIKFEAQEQLGLPPSVILYSL